ncbi:hypothetical protein D3C72_1936080 [compost metagenome]
MRNAKVQAHLVQKIGFGQQHAPGLEVPRHIKTQPVGARAQAGVVEQRRVGAAIAVEHQALQQRGGVAMGGIQRDLHASRGAAVHRVQNVGTKAHGESPEVGTAVLLESGQGAGCRPKVYTLFAIHRIMPQWNPHPPAPLLTR